MCSSVGWSSSGRPSEVPRRSTAQVSTEPFAQLIPPNRSFAHTDNA
jgi:hypothetical protein